MEFLESETPLGKREITKMQSYSVKILGGTCYQHSRMMSAKNYLHFCISYVILFFVRQRAFLI